MLFNSFIFFILLGLVLPIFYFLRSKTSKNAFLLLASYLFYGYWDWRFCLLLLISTLVDFYLGKKIFSETNKKKKKQLVFISLAVNLGILAFFKYFNFFIGSFEELVGLFGQELDYLHLNIILPVGISFYTFQTLSYSLDIYRGKLKPTYNLIDFALFVSFFPQLVAGPIERASNLIPQLSKKLQPTKQQLVAGINLVVIGLFKKVMIGDTTGRFVDQIFGTKEAFSGSDYLFALILFSIQIYADFSGYSSIARGVAKLLGVELIKNFEQPYLSRNITEFWRRWHISLSTWLRDYLYIPLGGNRKGTRRTYINLLLTMLIGGLWHGASWNFVIWGGIHGIYLAFHKLLLGDRRPVSSNITLKEMSLLKFVKVSSNILLTYVLVLFTWLFFRSTDFHMTLNILSEIGHMTIHSYSLKLLQITLVFLFVTIGLDIWQYKTAIHGVFQTIKNPILSWGINLLVFTLTLLYMFQLEPLPFIYFQF